MLFVLFLQLLGTAQWKWKRYLKGNCFDFIAFAFGFGSVRAQVDYILSGEKMNWKVFYYLTLSYFFILAIQRYCELKWHFEKVE